MYEKKKTSGFIYTTIFKTYNLEIESPIIQLSESAWIECSPSFIDKPNSIDLSFASFSGFSSPGDPQLGLQCFFHKLVSSAIIFGTKHAEEEFERNPFQVHDCAYIAAAISIICDPWFVVGIEIFSNNRNPDYPSLGPWTTFFVGENLEVPARICRDEEKRLIRTYKFVYDNLALFSRDSEIGRLILLFLRCVTRTPYQRFNVLKLGLDHLFTEFHATILNAALFFEYLLTKKSGPPRRGIQHWNKIFSPNHQLDENLIDLIFQYRHVVAHFNPTGALNKIKKWKDKVGIDDEKALDAIRRAIWSNAKTCLRAIVEDEKKFKSFYDSKPN